MRCAVFLLVVCVVQFLLVFLSNKISPLYEVSVKRLELFEASVELDSIVFGNSHALGIYMPGSERVFHFLSSSEDVYETFGKMSQVLDSQNQLKCAIVNISPLLYLHSNVLRDPRPRYRYYYLWGEDGKLNDDSINNYWKGRLSRLIRNDKWKSVMKATFLKLQSNSNQSSLDKMTKNGYIYRPYFFDKSENSKELAKLAAKNVSNYISQFNEQRMKNLKDDALYMMREKLSKFTDSDIKFIFVTPSYLPEFFPLGFSSTILGDNFYSVTSETFISLTNEFNNVHYFDFLNDSRMSDPSFYYDDHMNEKGAIKFTQLLKQTLKDNNLDCGLN